MAPDAGDVIVAAGRVASRLIVTDLLLVPPALVAVQVYVAPEVSAVIATVPHPLCAPIDDWASVTAQLTFTLLVYQPLAPSVPLTVGVIAGGVVSLANTGPVTNTATTRLRTDANQNFFIVSPAVCGFFAGLLPYLATAPGGCPTPARVPGREVITHERYRDNLKGT